jgi:hypothetical protein
MFMTTLLVLGSIGLDAAATNPCHDITAPPVIIHATHAAPIEVAVAWHSPVDGQAALQPPLEALGDRCDGTTWLGPGPILAGDTIAQGTLSNTGGSTIFILTRTGELILIPEGHSLWVGDDGGLTPTHRCMCICTCSGPGFSETIISQCNGLGGCARNGESCEILDDHGKIRSGVIFGCTVVYSPIPNRIIH